MQPRYRSCWSQDRLSGYRSRRSILPKRSIPFLIVVGLFGVGLGFIVSILDPFIYTEKVRQIAPATLKNTVLSFITIMALIVALVIQPLVGRWSDRTYSRRGKRTPYLTGGVIGLSLALVLIVVADSWWLLIIAAMVTSASSNTIQGVWQALIPDQVPQSQRGTAAGIKTLLELIGIVAGVALVGITLVRGNLWGAPLAAIGLFAAILLITLFTLWRMGRSADRPVSESTNQPGGAEADAKWSGRANERNGAETHQRTPVASTGILGWLFASRSLAALIRRVPAFPWWMLNRFLFWSAAIAVRTFIINYMEDVLSLSLPQAEALSSRLFMILGIAVLVLALPAGAIADRIGRQPLLVIAGLLAAGGTLPLILVRDLNLLFVAGGLIAAGAGIFASTSWALATDLVPNTEGALYLGLANGATVVGSIGGRLGGPLIDGTNRVTGTVTIGYLVVLGIAALFFAGSSAVVLKIPKSNR